MARPRTGVTPIHKLRIDNELWDRFGQTAGETDRSYVLREFIRWYVRDSESKLPPRPSAEA